VLISHILILYFYVKNISFFSRFGREEHGKLSSSIFPGNYFYVQRKWEGLIARMALVLISHYPQSCVDGPYKSLGKIWFYFPLLDWWVAVCLKLTKTVKTKSAQKLVVYLWVLHLNRQSLCLIPFLLEITV
jgi:hypothetical protein